jgi:serine/threonine protein kinase
VLDWVSRGVNGAVYRVVRIGQEHLPPAALKLALLPDDPRFQRERELLSRCLHPHIPRLLDSGFWLSPSGARYPFVSMEWIDGVPLYDWARMFHPSAAQQLRLLSQAALALQYLHAQDALHRDLKGGNLLVRRSDSRLFVTDFGSSIYPDAASLTPQQLPPGTPVYRSPEAWLFTQRHRLSSERYRPGPGDDVFALGVTACVLATGKYPDMGDLKKDAQGSWSLEALRLPRALSSAQVPAPQREVILQMLAIRPEERISAAELPPALERAADSLCSFSSYSSDASAGPSALPEQRSRRFPWISVSSLGAFLARAVGVALLLLLGVRDGARPAPDAEPLATCASSSQGQPTDLGEAAASAAPSAGPPSTSQSVAAETLPEPADAQARPDKKGRCPHPRQVILNGACWGRTVVSREECDALQGEMYQGACYLPVFPPNSPTRPKTSGAKAPR